MEHGGDPIPYSFHFMEDLKTGRGENNRCTEANRRVNSEIGRPFTFPLPERGRKKKRVAILRKNVEMALISEIADEAPDEEEGSTAMVEPKEEPRGESSQGPPVEEPSKMGPSLGGADAL
uniref:Uncharacterized protein n=1 Tax=Musa acuminata subsp. malaccensis TaxID=214687 RepID=A0A804KHT0_MUSAM